MWPARRRGGAEVRALVGGHRGDAAAPGLDAREPTELERGGEGGAQRVERDEVGPDLEGGVGDPPQGGVVGRQVQGLAGGGEGDEEAGEGGAEDGVAEVEEAQAAVGGADDVPGVQVVVEQGEREVEVLDLVRPALDGGQQRLQQDGDLGREAARVAGARAARRPTASATYVVASAGASTVRPRSATASTALRWRRAASAAIRAQVAGFAAPRVRGRSGRGRR
nr:hypothetical protein [Nocardioides humi]